MGSADLWTELFGQRATCKRMLQFLFIFLMFRSILKRRISSGLKRAVSSDLLKRALCMDALHSNGLLFTFIAGSFAKVVS